MDISSFQIAKKICELGNWNVTNLSIQKILYFCHMFYLGKTNGKPLVNEFFEAWDYGPVLPNLYKELRMFGANSVESVFFYKINSLENEKINSLIEPIAKDLVKRSAWQLVALTHSRNGAWAKNYVPGMNECIPNEDILIEYKEKGL